MALAFDLVFDTASLEERFRRMVKNAGGKEVGGWFIVGWGKPSWEGYQWSRFKRIMRRETGKVNHPHFIRHIVAAPNDSDNPKHSFGVWDFEKAWSIAETTAKMYGGSVLHFHSHPNNIGEPSEGDLVFAGHYCQLYKGFAHICIVTPDPLRLWSYNIRYSPNSPDNSQMECGRFWSWRLKAMQPLKQLI